MSPDYRVIHDPVLGQERLEQIVVSGGDVSRTVSLQIAGETLSGHRIVTTASDGRVIYADPFDAVRGPLWLTLQAAVTDDTVLCAMHGIVDNGPWAWTPQARLFLRTDGVVSEAQPTTEAVVQVATAIEADKIFFSPSMPISLTN